MNFRKIKKLISMPLVLLRVIISKDYRLIWRLKVFDAQFFGHGFDKKDILEDLLWEYLKSKVPDYHQYGIEQLTTQLFVDPHPLFDTSFYLSKYFPNGFKGNPFAHYLREGWKKGFSPSPFFDQVYYSTISGWQPNEGDPLSHYTRYSFDNFISPGNHFDVEYYFDKSPFVFKGVKNLLIRQYRLYGITKGRNPGPLFDADYYRKYLDKQGITVRDPFLHYIVMSDCSNNRPNEWFDPDYYIKGCQKKLKRSAALSHYLSEGVFQRRYVNHEVEHMKYKPIISIIVPVYNPHSSFLNNCIRSVLYQTYPYWELCLADDCSTSQETRDILKKWAAKDSRIKVTYLQKNSGISIATNAAAALATGDYLGFLDNDDELSLDCLFNIADSVNITKSEIFYTDEDLIGVDGRRLSVFRKPKFNPELLLSHNYITHFFVISRTLFESAGSLNRLSDGAQDYDLILKTTELASRVIHINKVLYHWRASENSTSINHDQKIYANDAGRKVLQNAIDRRGIDGVAENTDLNFFYRLSFSPQKSSTVSIIVWLENISEKSLLQVLNNVKSTSYSNVEFVIVYKELAGTSGDIKRIKEDIDFTGILLQPVNEVTGKFEALNRTALAVKNDYLVFLDQNVKTLSTDWVEQLLGPFCLGDIGLVCGRLLFGDGDGFSYAIPDTSIKSGEYFHDFLTSCSRHLNGMHCLQQISCCSSEITMIRSSLFKKIGGFDNECFPYLFAMTDLSIRAAEMGEKILYTPYARANIDYTEWQSRNSSIESAFLINEMIVFKKKWVDLLQTNDTFYNSKIIGDNGADEHVFLPWLTGKTH